MKQKDRENICSNLLAARGWISCWFPLGMAGKLNDDYKLTVHAGPLQSALIKIDETLDQLGHTGSGSCKKD